MQLQSSSTFGGKIERFQHHRDSIGVWSPKDLFPSRCPLDAPPLLPSQKPRVQTQRGVSQRPGNASIHFPTGARQIGPERGALPSTRPESQRRGFGAGTSTSFWFLFVIYLFSILKLFTSLSSSQVHLFSYFNMWTRDAPHSYHCRLGDRSNMLDLAWAGINLGTFLREQLGNVPWHQRKCLLCLPHCHWQVHPHSGKSGWKSLRHLPCLHLQTGRLLCLSNPLSKMRYMHWPSPAPCHSTF